MADEGQEGSRPQLPTIIEISNRLQLPAGAVKGAGEATAVLARALELGCNLLAARAVISEIPESYRLFVRALQFPTTGGTASEGAKWSNGVWYEVEGGKLALHRASLDKIAGLAGITSIPELCRVEQVEPYLWRGTHVVRIREITGQWRNVVGSVEVDGRTDPPGRRLDPKDKTDRALVQVRKFGARNAEAKARNRAIRSAVGLQGAYTEEEARRPFVFPALIYSPDLSNPEIAKMVAASELGIVAQVYGPAAPRIGVDMSREPPLPDDVLDVDIDDEPPPVRQAASRQVEERPREERPVERQTERIAAHPDDARSNRDPDPAGSCEVCDAAIEVAVASYSKRNFNGRLLCMSHQPKRDRR